MGGAAPDKGSERVMAKQDAGSSTSEAAGKARVDATPVRRAGSKGKPKLVSGGNPQIAKGYGDALIQAYIDAMPGWKQDVGRRIDAIVTRSVPGVAKAV